MLAQSQPNCLGTGGLSSWIDVRKIPYPENFLRLLRRGGRAKRKGSEQKSFDSFFSPHGLRFTLAPIE
jgi:hypothetical protein